MKGEVLIGILSCKKYADRADAQRRTWIPLAKEAGYDVEVFDGERLMVPDDYLSLPLKTRALCRWAFEKGYRTLFKVDDDCYVHVKNLSVPPYDYAGIVFPPNDCGNTTLNIPPFPRGTIKFPYASGGGYWLSDKAMQIIIDAPCDDWAEDRWVGQVLGRAGITPHQLKDYFLPGYLPPRPKGTPFYDLLKDGKAIIITQILTINDMMEAHEILTGKCLCPLQPPPQPPTPPPPKPRQMHKSMGPILVSAHGYNQNWRNNVIGTKVNYALSRGFRFIAVCSQGSPYQAELRKAFPGYAEEIVETEGGKILFIVR